MMRRPGYPCITGGAIVRLYNFPTVTFKNDGPMRFCVSILSMERFLHHLPPAAKEALEAMERERHQTRTRRVSRIFGLPHADVIDDDIRSVEWCHAYEQFIVDRLRRLPVKPPPYIPVDTSD
ncbi:unnamed protein product [Vitrella brassicaformis CCMP3155]|uniref:Uncharacterized protein n=1 Tax=Vitrella brassicaformis (strain CCMP3155) TaxID=1169540 RepID=A0A0G4GTG1_VITBC|nr:unnamed protein product [Vitrella brassicaformis CCMP3155]|eukprot:CEM34062.1 unnamed protein product [Vitrella brassicaformis CCMP3155]